MATLVLLFFKILYYKKIKQYKKTHRKSSSEEALLAVANDKALKLLKSKSKLITWTIVSALLIEFITIILIIVILANFMTQLLNIAGLVSMDFYNTPKYDENGEIIEDGSWDWGDAWDNFWNDLIGGGAAGDDNISKPDNGSGGAYPKDATLRVRQQYLEAADKVAKLTGVPIDPAWIIGVGPRESGSGEFRFSSNQPDLYKDLVMLDSFCGKGSGCRWISSGHSHIQGGSVSNNKDNGSPYTQVFSTNKGTYDAMGGDHAIGPYQFELIYLYNSICKYKYPSTTEVSNPTMDTSLGFMRPNPLYVPDALMGNAMLHAYHWNRIPSTITNSNDFKALSEKNRNIIKFCVAGSMYGWGSYKPWMGELARELTRVAKNKDLDTLLSPDKYWDDGTLSVKIGSHTSAIADFKAAGVNYNGEGSHFVWSGLQAVNYGRIEWDKLTALINAAEKDESSGGIGGSGLSGEKVFPIKSTSGFTPYISSQFGYRKIYPTNHQGIDIAGLQGGNVTKGQPEYCPVDSYVTQAGWQFAMGNYVKLSPVNDSNLVIIFMHMESPGSITIDGKSVLLKDIAGDKSYIIKAGTQVGKIGATGNVSGHHLHLEVQTLNANDKIVGSASPSMGAAIPPLHALYGSSWKDVMALAGVQLGGGISNNTKDKLVTWKGKTLDIYYIK